MAAGEEESVMRGAVEGWSDAHAMGPVDESPLVAAMDRELSGLIDHQIRHAAVLMYGGTYEENVTKLRAAVERARVLREQLVARLRRRVAYGGRKARSASRRLREMGVYEPGVHRLGPGRYLVQWPG